MAAKLATMKRVAEPAPVEGNVPQRNSFRTSDLVQTNSTAAAEAELRKSVLGQVWLSLAGMRHVADNHVLDYNLRRGAPPRALLLGMYCDGSDGPVGVEMRRA